MTRFLLVRHATGPHVGHALAGRAPGGHLGGEGHTEAARLAERLMGRGITAVYASPIERARETAAPLAARLGLATEESPAFTELDFGEWTGRTMAGLADDERWRHFNGYRSGTRIPGGELLLDVQHRAVSELLRLRARHPHATVAIVTHADVIRAVLAHVAGVPIDLVLRFEVDTASVTEIALDDWGPRIFCVNARA